MRGIWTRSAAPPPHDPIRRDDADSVSVKPAPVPIRALSAPFPTQEDGSTAQHDDSGTTSSGDDRIPIPTSSQTTSTSSASPRQEHSPLPQLPFVPSPDKNPDLKGFSPFKPDPTSILLQYPRSSIDRVQDFYEIYNPPERGLWSAASSVVMSGVAAIGKTFMTFGAYTSVYNLNPFTDILFDSHRTRPILTVTNHASTTDDPLLWGALPWKCYIDPTRTVRYALGAQELCYPNKPVSAFFRLGQIVPIIRGIGIYQPAIDKSINLLRSGRWVHIFPEGKINQTDQLIRLKWGVGRILMEYGGPPVVEGGQPMDELEMPIVIPIYHVGLEDVLRLYEDNSSPVIPKFGMPLTIVFGEPIDFRPLMKDYKEGKLQEVEARIKITERVYDALDELKLVAQRLHQEQIEKIEKDRIQKGRWWWMKPIGWGWWRSKDVDINSRYRDTTVKIEELR
ncbi:acyltransferase-domain-containing protein [Mortierella sp. GBAus27b]|nr:acyltransferase-domain-containing protein [Mortierella sp. GBAus27b]